VHIVSLAVSAMGGVMRQKMGFVRDLEAQYGRANAKDGQSGSANAELDRLAQFFPDGTKVKVPVQVVRLPLGSSEKMATVLEYGTSREVIFRCAVPMEFGDRVRLTNKDGSLDTEAEITAVQIGMSEILVAARFLTEIPNWIIKA
jgi:hypothetical protein